MAEAGQRIDKWLFFARVVKSRSLAQKFVQTGAVRINRDKTDNPARIVRPGDVLTISLRGGVRVLKVASPGARRGPASEAATLYEDLSAPKASEEGAEAREERPDPAAPGFDPGERAPDKKQRRALARLKRGEP